MPSLRDWGWVVVRRAGRPHTQRQDPRVQAGAVPTFRKIRERWGTLYFLASTSCIGPFVGEHTPLDDKSRLSARAVPTGLGSNLPCLPRTYVRGYYMPSLRDSVLTFHAYPALTRGAITCRPFGTWFLSPLLLTPGLTCGANVCRPCRDWVPTFHAYPALTCGAITHAVPSGLGSFSLSCLPRTYVRGCIYAAPSGLVAFALLLTGLCPVDSRGRLSLHEPI